MKAENDDTNTIIVTIDHTEITNVLTKINHETRLCKLSFLNRFPLVKPFTPITLLKLFSQCDYKEFLKD